MIKIDMEMPLICRECTFAIIEKGISWFCAITKKDVNFYGREKEKDCPLIECENEKSCENCKNLKVRKDYIMCDEYSKWQAK